MSIFAEFGGKDTYYTANELDRLQNPEKYDYDQESYDRFAAQAAKKADARAAALEASQDAIPYSYVGRGTGATNPAFSFAGYSGHTSGGTSGLSGFGGLAGLFGSGSTTETQGSGSDGGDDTRGPGRNPRDYEGETQLKAEGGVITSPYANPMKRTMGPIPMNQPSQGPGIEGIFKQMQQQTDQMMSSPLQVYSQYLAKTYVQPEAAGMVNKVHEFVDLVDQAERAHFGVEESFGFGDFGNPVQRPPMQVGTFGPNDGLAAMPPPMEMGSFEQQSPVDRGIASLPAAY